MFYNIQYQNPQMIKIVGSLKTCPHNVAQLLFGAMPPRSLSSINEIQVCFASAPEFPIIVNVVPEIEEYVQANELLRAWIEIRVLTEQEITISFAITAERVIFVILGSKERCEKMLAFQALEEAYEPIFTIYVGGDGESEEMNTVRSEIEKAVLQMRSQ